MNINSLFSLLRIICFSFLLLHNNHSNIYAQNWFDKLKEKVNEVKGKVQEKLEENTHPCISCGKPIRLGSKCLTCITKEKSELIQKKSQDLSHPCIVCGKKIHIGNKCLTCIAQEKKIAAQKKWEEISHPCNICGKLIHLGTKCAACLKEQSISKIKLNISEIEKSTSRKCLGCGKKIHLRDYCLTCVVNVKISSLKSNETIHCTLCGNRILFGKVCGSCYLNYNAKKINEYSKYVSPKIVSKVREYYQNPIKRDEVIGTIGMLQKIFCQDQIKNNSVNILRSVVKNVKVSFNGNEGTLEDHSKSLIEEHAPFLVGTDIYEDPAMVVIYLATSDYNYFITQFRVIPSPDGGFESLSNSISRESGIDNEKIDYVLELIDSAEAIRDQSSSVEDYNNLLNIFSKTIQKTNQK